MKNIGIGLAGFGTVGAGVYQNILSHKNLILERSDFSFLIKKILIQNPEKERDILVPSSLLITDWQEMLTDPDIQIIVELIGGKGLAFELIKASLESGRTVITGNKELLAEKGSEIFALAQKHNTNIFFEAAVAGAIPIIQVLKDAFIANKIESMHGILNGTSNYILTKMQDHSIEYESALQEAIEHGYAEANPSLDINGWDTAHKAIILVALAYGFWIDPRQIQVHGIESVTLHDIHFAKKLGYSIKLLASIIKKEEKILTNIDDTNNVFHSESLEVTVAPTLIPTTNILSSVQGVFNAIEVCGDLVGSSLFYGQGAGRNPTASSVIADLVKAASFINSVPNNQNVSSLQSPFNKFIFFNRYSHSKIYPLEKQEGYYYIRFSAENKPGTLAAITGILGNKNIGISSVLQPESLDSLYTPLVLMLHKTKYQNIKVALDLISELPCINGLPLLLQVKES